MEWAIDMNEVCITISDDSQPQDTTAITPPTQATTQIQKKKKIFNEKSDYDPKITISLEKD